MVHLDRIVRNVFPGACLKTNSIACYCPFLYPNREAVFAIGSLLIPLTIVPCIAFKR